MQANQAINIEALLKRIPLFSGMSPNEVSRVANATREVRINKGETLFNKGDAYTGIHLLIKGQIKLTLTSAQGNEKIIEIVNEGQSFGEAIMFLDTPYVVSAQALSNAKLLHVSKTVIFEELENHHDLAHKMLASMAMRLHQLMNDVESYSLQSSKQRIIGYLMRELPENSQNATNIVLTLSSNKGVIASRLNLTQEHFSRTLNELTSLGLIQVDGKKIHIASVASLRKYES